LTSQIAISKRGRGGRRTLPYAFTEHGALMAANLLNSPRAVAMSLYVIRAFIKMREDLAANAEIISAWLKLIKSSFSTTALSAISTKNSARCWSRPRNRQNPKSASISKKIPFPTRSNERFSVHNLERKSLRSTCYSGRSLKDRNESRPFVKIHVQTGSKITSEEQQVRLRVSRLVCPGARSGAQSNPVSPNRILA